ncbi:titin homolog isoform X2 [Parasteatoda tepidariorum]|uniref:titin homolog isoform X2 n=1 Tax=Parasteatoda tepidariorum TaxID=114398 RepID=UPI001C721510|nr:uncharacterized protein LOC107452888 isoform X2 [Parasteatoda tepidariorum]
MNRKYCLKNSECSIVNSFMSELSSSFPYFGALYNNSLPPTAYRLQPGCMPNLGQFWPPTPPPDGCGRFDGNNLYFGHPVLRHGENLTSNLRNSLQGLGHYSHLAETPKESTQRVFKQEKVLSPNVNTSSMSMCSSGSKSDNLNACCVVESKLKSQCSVSRSLPKQELLTVSSGHEPYLFASDIRSSSSMHPSTDKSCFSSAYSLKGNIHSPPQEKSMPATQENNCNASPLKNVYFSHYESENSMQFKNSIERAGDEHFYSDHKQPPSLNSSKSKHPLQPLSDCHFSSNFSKKSDFHGIQDFHKTVTTQRISDTSFREQHKQKTSSSKVKPEKSNPYDCKYQKSNSRSSSVIQISENKTPEVLNIPTSMMQPKIEPKDKYFMSSCPSTSSNCLASSYASSSSPFILTNSSSRSDVSSYQNSFYQNPCSLNKSWSYNDLPMISPDNYFKPPEAAKPPSRNQNYASPVLHDNLISVAQTAPPDMLVTKYAVHSSSPNICSPVKKRVDYDVDDEVQIIGVQNKSSSSKHISKHNSEKRIENHQPTSNLSPLCLKNQSRDESLGESVPTSQNQEINIIPPRCHSTTVPPKQSPLTLDIPESNLESSANLNDCDVEFKHSVKVEPQDAPSTNESENKVLESDLARVKKESENTLITSQDVEAHNKNDCVAMDTETTVENAKTDVEVKNSNVLEANKEESKPLPEFNVNHGLHLLLDTIEKVTSFEVSSPLKTNSNLKTEDASNVKDKCNHPCNSLKIRGLELLSTIAVERLVSEFDVIKIEPKDSPVCSNYPQIKEEPKQWPEDELSKQGNEVSEKPVSTVFEMHDKLLELQKKYKQKQKELLRLKPKKRFANMYMKDCPKLERESLAQKSDSNSNSQTNDAHDSSANGLLDSDQCFPETEDGNKSVPEHKYKNSIKGDVVKRRPKRCQASFKKESSVEILSEDEVRDMCARRRFTRRSSGRKCMKFLRSSIERKRLSVSSYSKNITRHQQKRLSRLKKKKEHSVDSSSDASSKASVNNSSVNDSSLPENIKKSKAYSLRHSSQSRIKKAEPISDCLASFSKALPSKRKSDNPKRYVPSKQGKMSETIIAKHLRNRILFDTSGSVSDEENAKDGVPDDLYDAFVKCHLVEERQKGQFLGTDENCETSAENPLGYPDPSKLTIENLVESHRLLALEEGLFYAGHIKECITSNRYGIALDGQRGNKLHTFTREELLTQTIVESKPVTSNLPEGTRVCAYWSQQYRCLYPGVIGKAPCPSADWSEPRVFVQFDDGDSGQIPIKNVRLIPPDIIPSGTDSRLENAGFQSESKCKENCSGKAPRRLRSSTPKKKHKRVPNENESKDSSCTSVNDSSCDDSCFMDYSLSPSQNTEVTNTTENHQPSSSLNYSKSEKKQRKHSKRKIASRTKSNRDVEEGKERGETKTKRHKKYKEKHRRHHHHHHRHHHHHHHHHHSKKRKHRRKTGKSPSSQDLDYENCIPCKKTNLKSHKTFDVVSTDLTQHSSNMQLPQAEKD